MMPVLTTADRYVYRVTKTRLMIILHTHNTFSGNILLQALIHWAEPSACLFSTPLCNLSVILLFPG